MTLSRTEHLTATDTQSLPICTIGILLAAGRGRRMGCTKQLIPWQAADGEKPLVAAAYDAIRPICDDMIVVVGHDAGAVAAALGERPFHRVESSAAAPMFESVRCGLVAAAAVDPTAVVVLQPGDHPEVLPTTLAILVDRLHADPTQVIIPTYGGRGGHPVLIPPRMAAILTSILAPNGLGEYWRAHPEHCVRVAVDDPRIVRDIDWPQDVP